jgi:hypothetical protein
MVNHFIFVFQIDLFGPLNNNVETFKTLMLIHRQDRSKISFLILTPAYLLLPPKELEKIIS